MPQPGPGDVRVKLGAVGVCGSDVHYYEEGRIGSAEVQYPTLLGHEPSGVVDAVGAGVDLSPGTRIAVEPAAPCMKCELCRAGKQNTCPNVRFLGTPPIDGIFEQYHLMPAGCCIPVPDEISLVEAAMLEPLCVGLHAVALADLHIGQTVAIFGSGPIGLVSLLAARAAGAAEVYMTDLVPERLALAKQLGATAAVHAGETDVVAWIKDLTHGRGVDATFEAAGAQQTMTHACECVRIGGRALIIGIPSVQELTMPMHICRRKELLLQHVRRSNDEIHTALPMVASGRIDIKPLATHFFGLDQVADAFDLVHRYADGVIRAVILPNPDLVEDEFAPTPI